MRWSWRQHLSRGFLLVFTILRYPAWNRARKESSGFWASACTAVQGSLCACCAIGSASEVAVGITGMIDVASMTRTSSSLILALTRPLRIWFSVIGSRTEPIMLFDCIVLFLVRRNIADKIHDNFCSSFFTIFFKWWSNVIHKATAVIFGFVSDIKLMADLKFSNQTRVSLLLILTAMVFGFTGTYIE